MSFPHCQRIHFTGIGGVGMSGLAHILLDWGKRVSGTDVKSSQRLDDLRAHGARISVGHDPALVDGADLLVFSSAVPDDDPELCRARELDVPVLRRGEFLAQLATAFTTVVAVAGSHGKTTTTAMLTHILRVAGLDPGFLIGGAVRGWLRSASAGDGTILVTEVDESDGTQALLRSSHAVVTNVDDDHCWSVGGVAALEQCFVDFADSATRLVAWDAPKTRALFSRHRCVTFVGFGVVPAALSPVLAGDHNRANAALASAAAERMGVPVAESATALASFPGVERRLVEHWRSPDGATVLVEDYAHHPTELRAALAALRSAYPAHRLEVVFQPHRFERVERYSTAFGRVLSSADRTVVVPPFAAWREDAGVADAKCIADAVEGGMAAFFEGSLDGLADRLLGAQPAAGAQRVLAVIGAGDICGLVPLLRNGLISRDLDGYARRLAQAVPGLAVIRDCAWSELTTLGFGAARPLLARPDSDHQLRALLEALHGHDLPMLVLGAGGNLVGTDEESLCIVVDLTQGEFARAEFAGSLTPGGAVDALAAARERRRGREPEGRSAGGVFRHPAGGQAGRLLGASGCSGMRVGGCYVSDEQANCVMIDEHAGEADLAELLMAARERVFEQRGVILMPAVVFAGASSRARIERQTAWFEQRQATGQGRGIGLWPDEGAAVMANCGQATSEQIVKQALTFQTPDRLPVFEGLWGEWEARWRQERGVVSDVSVDDHFPMDIAICTAKEVLFPSQVGPVKEEDGYVLKNDGWGRTILTRPGTYFSETVDRVLNEPSDLDRIEFEPVALDMRYEGVREKADRVRAQGRAAFVKIGGIFIRTSFFRGETEFLMDMAADEPFAQALVERMGEHLLGIGLESLRRTNSYDTGVWVYDDMCNVNGPMFSPAMFERIFVPVYKRIVSTLKSAGARWVVMHCDGNLEPLLDLLIEAGFDGVNPVERNAGMIVEELLPKYFGRLFFIGGVCNIQILPRGTAAEVRAHVERIVDAGRNGGLVIGTHSIGPDIPVERYELYREIVADRGAYR